MIRFEVLGDPMTQGSKSAFVRGGRAVIVEGKGPGKERHKSWREAVRSAAQEWWETNGEPAPLDEPVVAEITVYLPRPASAPKRVVVPYKGLDVDKLARSILDSISGVLIRDDARVVDLHVGKRFATDRPTGAVVTVHTWAEIDVPRAAS